MSLVTKKITPEWFEAIQSGKKDYELRLADFNIEEGDTLRLEEWIDVGDARQATGRILEKKVTHVRKVDLNDWIKAQPEIVNEGFFVIRF